MGEYQRQKGKRGEREVVKLFKEHGLTAERSVQHCGRSSDSSDVRVKEMPFVNIECKLGYSSRLDAWFDKCLKEAPGKEPVVFHRRDNQEWLATVRAPWLIHLFAGFYSHIIDE